MTPPQPAQPIALAALKHPPQVEPISWEWHGVTGADGKAYVLLLMHTPGAIQTFTFLPEDLVRFGQQAIANAQTVGGGLIVASALPGPPESMNGHREG